MSRDPEAEAERALPVYLQVLKRTEGAAEDVLSDQQQVVELDKRRQTNRQAIRAVEEAEEANVWVMMGSEFLKVEKGQLKAWLDSDQKVLDKEIDRLRDGLKEKVNYLKQLEGKELPSGFYLKSMKKSDLSDIGEVGRVTETYLDMD